MVFTRAEQGQSGYSLRNSRLGGAARKSQTCLPSFLERASMRELYAFYYPTNRTDCAVHKGVGS